MTNIILTSPLDGWACPLQAVPDPVFSEQMLGDGMAIDPVEGRLIAPAAGTIISVHPAGHAVTMALDSGPVLLIHVGLDTVALGGTGFSSQICGGQRVGASDTLIEFDLHLIARRARSLLSPVIVTNGDAFRLVSRHAEGPVKPGEPLFTLEARQVEFATEPESGATITRELQLLLAHGIHARPAGRLAKLATEFDAQVEIVAENGRVAPVRSPVTMLGMGLGHGARFMLRARGPEAEQALDALVELLDSGMGELLPIRGAEPPFVNLQPPALGSELHGIVAVSGMAIGPAWALRQVTIEISDDAIDANAERNAFRGARRRVEKALRSKSQGPGPAAAIAEAQLAMLEDPVLEEIAQRLMGAGKSAGFAWKQALEQLAEPLRQSHDRRFAERLDDLVDLERQVLAQLVGQTVQAPRPPEGAIIVADSLYASQLTMLAESGVAGIATAAGGATSHAAIIAAGLGLPMLVGLGPSLTTIADGTPLILRGDSLIVAPDASMLDSAKRDAVLREERRSASRGRAHELAITSDGRRIETFANLGSVAEAEVAVAEGADGCGLLRTEFLFLNRDSPPGETEQRAAYQAIADELGERPLIVRTLDIGADKPASWLPILVEDNPALGLRGIRLQLAHRDLLDTQLRALLGVRSNGPLRIMLPMIASVVEVREVKRALLRLAREMVVEPPEIGIMVETPAAALMAKNMAEEAAFFSIGTNDLSQYALARDRTNCSVADGLDPLDPAVLRLIAETVIGGRSNGRQTGVCGGLAAIPEAVPILLGLGVTELSVPPAAIAETKAAVRALDLIQCRALAVDALGAADAEAVRALVRPIRETVR